ncbi:polysaccharide biosynthesis protein [Microbacterium esteraromaticum]|uniref:Polysaccharide biosynthesis protein n=1 Tax=Microbacterium esteraromaticum TaxID=57043 RepID=A0A939DUQ4_9MICO|nr:nucleoside-diphosphate sugar epimerase/dehydratase [Microbacterium esteraromaticum]MBN8205349.1 polysaccharide biosynthesis protein [Microbacterium esteraromaticum]MBN8415503.1 polysaccharide biosynthesis protein [Microbacterium esteraromaticum]
MAAIVDGAAWVLGVLLAVMLRFELAMPPHGWAATIVLALVAGALQVAAGYATKLYRGRHTYGSFDEVLLLGLIVLSNTFVLGLLVIMFGVQTGVPRGTMFLAAPIVLLLMFGVRYMARLMIDRSRKPGNDAEPALIVGAGYIADKLLHNITTDPTSPIRPIGLVDDDEAKRNLVLRGVPVVGRTSQIEEAIARTGAKMLVIAIGQADSVLLRSISDRAVKAGARVAITPSLNALASGELSPTDVRDISIEDLIGRHPVDTNVELIAGYITGKRVLVTGAGGSIGSELCRQLSKFGPAELIMLDRDETGLQLAQLGTSGHGLLHTDEVVLANIREEEVITSLFEKRRPEVVFHAAALKHLPMLEQYPDEAWKTNVLGTRNVLAAAMAVGVEHFVNISTDKAANPTSVLGHSKRVAEKLTAWAAEQSGMNYVSVRFGNVIGSRGSMLPTFQALIREGKPLTVTHPDATRFFMTIPEACQLVIQAGGIGRPGEVLILDMGEPVSILEVAKRMIAMSGKKIEIVFTGLRSGEKLHEELVGSRENLERPFHPQVSHTRADSISPERLDKAGWKARMRAEPRDNDTSLIEMLSIETVRSNG